MPPDEWTLDVVDESEPQIRELVWEYGFGPTMRIARQYYGRWDEARAVLEAERQRLQVSRWGNIR